MIADIAKSKRALIPGWIAVAILILVLVAFASIRSFQTYVGAENVGNDPFAVRYLEHPIVAGLHMFFSIAFILLAPLQFAKKFRARHPKVHRYLGRFLVFCALVSGVYGMYATAVMPGFGGLPAVTASYFFGPIFLACAVLGFWHAYNKRFKQHREWMIRLFALALGVGTQRVMLALFIAVGGVDFYEGFGTALWIGFALNLILAEIWINLSRQR